VWNAVEHLACGAGLVNIYDFLRVVNPSGRPQSQLQQERDPPSVGKGAMLVSASSVNQSPILAGTESLHSTHVPSSSLPYPGVCCPPEPVSAWATAFVTAPLSYSLKSSMCCQVWIDALTTILQCLTPACLVVVMLLRPWMPCTPE